MPYPYLRFLIASVIAVVVRAIWGTDTAVIGVLLIILLEVMIANDPKSGGVR